MRVLYSALVAAACTSGCAGWGGQPAAADIRGVQWRAVEIGGKPVLATHRPASMLLAAQARASGSGSCNQWFADYQLRGSALSFGQIGSTRMGCGGPVGDQERAYFDILKSVDRYSFAPNGALTLSTPQGQSITFRPARALPPATSLQETNGRSLDSLPAGENLTLVRQDLITTAGHRFGETSMAQARAAPTFLIAKRFVGMAPPPPPGAGPDWVPPTPTSLLMRGSDGWMVATATGWRRAKAAEGAELDQLIQDPRFLNEPAYIPPCPDYGSSLLLLKVSGRAEIVRKSACNSVAEKVVFAALEA